MAFVKDVFDPDAVYLWGLRRLIVVYDDSIFKDPHQRVVTHSQVWLGDIWDPEHFHFLGGCVHDINAMLSLDLRLKDEEPVGINEELSLRVRVIVAVESSKLLVIARVGWHAVNYR